MITRKLKLRNLATMIACLAVSTLFASSEKPSALTGETDVEFNIYVFGKYQWTPFAGKTGITFTNSDDNVLSITDNGTELEFTGKQVGESTITATLGEQTLKALVRVRAVEAGKKYFTYNKPVTAYYIEYNGGMSNQIERFDPPAVEAYENGKYSRIHWYGSGWGILHIRNNGSVIIGDYQSTEWFPDADAENPYNALISQYPLDAFGAWATKYADGRFMRFDNAFDNGSNLIGNGLWANALSSEKYILPNNTDVTEFYVRSEKVMDIMCDVYRDTVTDARGTSTWTFWVDPVTGFTLKFDDNGDTESSYEVTKLIIGSPDWDGKHLRPLATDVVHK